MIARGANGRQPSKLRGWIVLKFGLLRSICIQDIARLTDHGGAPRRLDIF